MTARKLIEETCTGSIDCPVGGHVVVQERRARRSTVTVSHTPLTHGQTRTLRERRLVAAGAIR